MTVTAKRSLETLSKYKSIWEEVACVAGAMVCRWGKISVRDRFSKSREESDDSQRSREN